MRESQINRPLIVLWSPSHQMFVQIHPRTMRETTPWLKNSWLKSKTPKSPPTIRIQIYPPITLRHHQEQSHLPTPWRRPFICNEVIWIHIFWKQQQQMPYHYCPCLQYSILQTWHQTPTHLWSPSPYRLHHHHIQNEQLLWSWKNNNYAQNQQPRTMSSQHMGRNHLPPQLLPYILPPMYRLHIILYKKLSNITSLNVRKMICYSVGSINKDKLGFTEDDAGSRSNLSSADMAM